MQLSKIPFLTTITKALFGKQQAAAQEQLFQLCAYGTDSPDPGGKSLDQRITDQLQRGADIDARNQHGDTPLIILARRGRSLEAKILIARGANVTATNNQGETAFLAAAAAGDGDSLLQMMAKGADPFQKNAAGHDAAHLMVYATADFKDSTQKRKQMEGLRALTDRGLKLDDNMLMAIYNHKPHLLEAAPEANKVHALSTSSELGDVANVELLLGLPVHPDGPAKFKDNTPMCWGAAKGNLDLMDTLLGAGADIELKSPKTHRTPLQSAVRAGQVEAFEYLLEKGAKIDAQMELLELARDNGQKPIMRAVYDAMIERGIMKTEVDTARATMKKIKLKTPGAV